MQAILSGGQKNIHNVISEGEKKDSTPEKLATVIVSGGRGRIVGLGIGAKSVFFTIEF